LISLINQKVLLNFGGLDSRQAKLNDL